MNIMDNPIFAKRGKKADLSINMIIIAIIAIVVLVVIIFIFNSQTKKVSGGYSDITNKALASRCESFLGEGGVCRSACLDEEQDVNKEKSSDKEVATWIDCDEKGFKTCCKPKPIEKK